MLLKRIELSENGQIVVFSEILMEENHIGGNSGNWIALTVEREAEKNSHDWEPEDSNHRIHSISINNCQSSGLTFYCNVVQINVLWRRVVILRFVFGNQLFQPLLDHIRIKRNGSSE